MILRNIMLWVSLLSLACSNPVLDVAKADYQASFSGTSFSGLTRSSTIAEYDGTIDDSGNLLDISGSNYFTYSSQFDNAAWTKAPGTASITADAVECPVGSNGAELFVEGTAGSGDTNQIVGQMQPSIGTGTYTLSIYVLFKAGGRSWFLLRNAGAVNKNAWFNAETGAAGTVESSVTDSSIRAVGGGWYQLRMQTTDTSPGSTWAFKAASADNSQTYTGDGRQAVYFCGAQLSKNDAWRKGTGVYHPTVAVNKPLHDLAPTNAPGEVATYLQRPDGNIWKGRSFNGSNQQYSIANHASFNIFDGNNTVTVVAASDAETNVLSRFDNTTGGDMGGIRLTSTYEIKYVKADGSYTSNIVNPCGGGVRTDAKYHAMHVIRTGNNAYATCDGSVGAPVDVSNAGIDLTSEYFFLGGASGVFFDGNILYVRIDAEALSTSQAVQEDQRLIGIGSTAGGNQFPEHSFTRATTATTEFSNGSLGYVASGAPRVTDGVAIESSRTNMVYYSCDMSNAAWGKTLVSVPSTSVVLPDGTTGTTNTIRSTADGGDPQVHYIQANNSGANFGQTNGTSYVATFYAKAAGAKNWLYLYNGASGGYVKAYVNLTTCTAGTLENVTLTGRLVPNGWCLFEISFTSAGTGGYWNFGCADANDDATTTGDGADWYYVWNLQQEAATVASSPIAATAAGTATRNADVLTINPFKYEDYVRVGTETMSITFDQDPATASITSNASADYDSGAISWTGAGTRVKEITERYGTYWKFDGASTRWSKSTETALTPDTSGAGANFSIVAAFIPDSQPGSFGYLFGRYDTGGNDREYSIYLNNTGGCSLVVSHDGTNPTFASKLSTCYTAGRPMFLAATYQYSGVADAPGATTGTSTGKLYVNDQSVVTDSAFLGPVRNGAASVYVGRSTGGSYFQGKFLWLNWYKGTVLDATTIANMYDQWKQKWLIAPQMGDANEEAKLYINFDYKLRSASASAAGDSLVEIGNSYGKSDANSNRISCAALTTTLVCSYWNDTTTATQRTITISGLTQNTWHSVAYYVDLADLANSTMTVDGVAGTKASMTGASSLNLRDASIHVGHDYTGAAGFANGWVKDVVVNSRP